MDAILNIFLMLLANGVKPSQHTGAQKPPVKVEQKAEAPAQKPVELAMIVSPEGAYTTPQAIDQEEVQDR